MELLNKIDYFLRQITMSIPMAECRDFHDYDAYWNNRGFADYGLNRARLIAGRIGDGCSVLDVGCGDGSLMEHLSSRRGAEVTGIDVSSKAVKHVRARGFEAHEMDVVSEEFRRFLATRKFDYIVMTELLEHIQDSEAVMECVRGTSYSSLFVSVPNAGFFVHRLRLLLGRFPVVLISEHIKEHIRFWTLRDFMDWCDFLGFEVRWYRASAGLFYPPLSFLERRFPSLFASQVVYELVER